jgi:hypothetical protein
MEDVKFGSESTTVGDPVLLHNKIAAIRLAGPKKLQVFFQPHFIHNSVSCVAFCISFSIILLCRHCSSGIGILYLSCTSNGEEPKLLQIDRKDELDPI